MYGEVEKDDGVLVIRRIRVAYTLKASRTNEEAILRAHDMHPPRCPVYKTLSGCIQITTEIDIIDA